MADCTVQGIADNATCFRCVPEKDLAAMQVYLLCQILQQLNPTMDCSPQGIRDASSCIRCALSGKELYAAMVYLLCQILDNATTGGGFDYLIIRNAPTLPEPPPTDQTKVWFLTFRSGLPGRVWDPTVLAWI